MCYENQSFYLCIIVHDEKQRHQHRQQWHHPWLQCPKILPCGPQSHHYNYWSESYGKKFDMIWYSLGMQLVLKGYLSRDMTKPTKRHVRPAKTQINLGICAVWSESSLGAWRKLGSLATHWAHSEDSDQTGRMPRLIWVFAGHTVILLVL